MTPATKKRILLGCGVVLLFAVLLAAACAGFVYYQVQQRFLTDPAKAQEMAQTIMGYEIPGGGQGFVAMDLVVVRMALVADDVQKPGVMLLLAEISQMEGQDPEKLKHDMTSRMFEKFDIERRTTQDGALDGTPVEITVTHGSARKRGNAEPYVSYETVVEHNQKHYVPVVFGFGFGPDAEARAAGVFASLRFR